MNDRGIFRIEYPTGRMELNVREFFGTADIKRIKKVLRLVRENCTEEQKADLISAIREIDKAITAALDAVGELEYRRRETLALFFGMKATARPPGSHEKLLVKQRDKLRTVVDLLPGKEVWYG